MEWESCNKVDFLKAPILYDEQSPWPLKIYTFGRFNLVREGTPMTFSGKIQQKPLEMLKALISLGGRRVTKKTLADFLWPDANSEESHRSFTITLHRLRRLLGNDKIIALHERKITLDSSKCWVDAWAFERLAGKVDARFKGGGYDDIPQPALGTALKAISLYRGDFLAEDINRPWSVSRRERLRGIVLRLVRMIGQDHEDKEELNKAIDCYLHGIETNELAEELYQRLMQCYHRMGCHGEIFTIFNRCRIALAMCGIKPSAKTKAIYEKSIFGN